MRSAVRFASVLLGFLVFSDAGSAKTPISKVVELLSQLQAQIEKEGAASAAQYDKLACYCKEHADSKQYAIEKSDALIETLTSEIDKLDGEITQLGTEITALGVKITDLDGKITAAVKQRGIDLGVYQSETVEVDEAINATIDAIAAIKAEKDKMVDAKNVKLMQLPTAVLKLIQASQVPISGKPHAYEYKSNNITGLLMDLQDQFKEQKAKLDKAEIDSVGEFKKTKTNLENQKKFAEEDKLERETLKAEKEGIMEAKTVQRTQETNDKNADKNFRDELTTTCQTKAEEWDANSKTRADELTAIAKAIEILKKDVGTSYDANKDLAGLAIGKKLSHGSVKDVAQSHIVQQGRALSFLQLRGSGSLQNAATHRALQLVDAEANRLKSAVLAGLAVKLGLKASGYGSTVTLIKDMIAKLEKEAQTEAALKQLCATDMATAIAGRDTQRVAMEKQTADIATKLSEKGVSRERISELLKDIAGIKTAQKEAGELRSSEEAQNAATKAEAEAGLQAVNKAIDILTTYYDGAKSTGFIEWSDAPKDRYNVTLAPPETEAAGYEGKQQLGGGIVGLLEEIRKDFERTIAQIDTDEATSKAEYSSFMGTSQGDVDTKSSDKDSQETNIVTLNSDITSLKDSLSASKSLYENELAEIAALVAKCTSGEDTWAEKKAKREAEIVVLKECVSILEGFDAKAGVAK